MEDIVQNGERLDMSLTRPIPKLAMKVVEEIRAMVPKPKDLPVLCEFLSVGNWHALRFLFDDGNIRCCPMGLHPKSKCANPFLSENFADGSFPSHEIVSYYAWWDNQTDAQAAVDAQWPEPQIERG